MKEKQTISANDVGTLDLTTQKENFEVAFVADRPHDLMISGDNLPDLANATEIPLDLSANYWTPKAVGESKRVFFDTVKMRMVNSQQDADVIVDLPCAFFYEKVGNDVKTISNGSKRLVGIFESGNIRRFTPLLITYLGKEKNATNGFSSDSWSVKELVING